MCTGNDVVVAGRRREVSGELNARAQMRGRDSPLGTCSFITRCDVTHVATPLS
jgi:hypothetical protein